MRNDLFWINVDTSFEQRYTLYFWDNNTEETTGPCGICGKQLDSPHHSQGLRVALEDLLIVHACTQHFDDVQDAFLRLADEIDDPLQTDNPVQTVQELLQKCGVLHFVVP